MSKIKNNFLIIIAISIINCIKNKKIALHLSLQLCLDNNNINLINFMLKQVEIYNFLM